MELLVRISSSNSEWHLAATIICCTLLFSLPWVFSYGLRKAKRSRPRIQFAIWLIGEVLLAASLLIAFVATLSALLVARDVIAPWIWSVPPEQAHLDEPLTPRLLFYWINVAAIAWFVFSEIGIKSVRDLHKVIKECHDLVLRNRKNKLRVRAGLENEESLRRSSPKAD